MMRLGVLGSTRGTNLEAILQAIAAQSLQASIQVVISNKDAAFILERAKTYHLPAYFINPTGYTRADYDARVTELLQHYRVDLVVLIGYMRILSADFVKQWENKIINIHPSLLPAFAGKMDIDVHAAVIAAGETETGCTVHYVTEEVDAGPIITQKKCPVFTHDEPQQLKTRVQALEGQALVEAINLIKY